MELFGPRRAELPDRVLTDFSQHKLVALVRAWSENSIQDDGLVRTLSRACEVHPASSTGPNSPAPSHTSAMAQQLVLTTGVPNAMASAAGMPKDSQLLIRQKTWWLA